MKILYGVQGTGNGHLTRARLMAEEFKRRGIEVDWVFSGRAPSRYFDMEIFGDYRTYEGLTFAVEKGRVNYLKSFMHSRLGQLWRDIKSLKVDQYDLIINDFEPISAWAARLAGKEVVGISHQCAFGHRVPRKNMGIGVRSFMRWFAPVTTPVGLHWDHFNQAILPPMVDLKVRNSNLQKGRILVYLPFANDTSVIDLLQAAPDHQFDVYLGSQVVLEAGNVRCHPFSRSKFQEHLASCEGVICSAGFELPSEALHLGKKLLAIPIKGQAEQESNAQALDLLGLADTAPILTPEVLAQWLRKSPPSPANYPNVAEALVEWLLAGRSQSVDALAERLWQKPLPRLTVARTRHLATSDSAMVIRG